MDEVMGVQVIEKDDSAGVKVVVVRMRCPSELRLRGLRSTEHAAQGCLGDGLQCKTWEYSCVS